MPPSEDFFQKAVNACAMEGVPCSLVVSCAGGSKISPLDVTSDQMGTESRLPSSIRAALSFVSGHATLEPLQFFSAYTDRAEFFNERLENGVNLHSIGMKENPIVIEDDHDEGPLSNMPTHSNSCSDSIIRAKRSMSFTQKQNNYVYKRRKLQRNSVTLLPKQAQISFGAECLPNDNLGSSWLPLWEKRKISSEPKADSNQHDMRVFANPQEGYPKNLLQSGNKVINSSSNTLSVEKYGTCLVNHIDCEVPDIKGISLFQEGSLKLVLDSGKMDMNIVDDEATSGSRSIVEDCASLHNQSSSSFEMPMCNLGQIAAPTKDAAVELAESTSSVVEAAEVSGESNPEKDWCISVLKEYGLLGWFLSSGEYAAAEHPGVVGDGSFSQLCKICGSLEDSTRTLICDMCEEAFHMSCCNPKVKSVPVADEWYCQSCRKKRKRPGIKSLIENRISQSILKEVGTKLEKPAQNKVDLFGCMLQDTEPYTTQVRIGKAFQADVPDWTGRVPDDAESPFMGEPLEEGLGEQNLTNETRSKIWQPADPFLYGFIENWLQCRNVVCEEGVISFDGRKAKDVVCGKWRRAPLSEVQSDDWDCSCAIVWDPFHADCAVPQELGTEEILRRLKASEMAKLQLVNKKRKNKVRQCIASEFLDMVEGRARLL